MKKQSSEKILFYETEGYYCPFKTAWKQGINFHLKSLLSFQKYQHPSFPVTRNGKSIYPTPLAIPHLFVFLWMLVE